MKTKDIIYELRNKAGLSQEELAQMIFVSRQAVSRWETGETMPSIDALRALSQVFNVSVDELLGSYEVENGCGDSEEYLYNNLDKLNNFCNKYLGKEIFDDTTETKVTRQDFVSRYKELSLDAFTQFKSKLIQEINDLHIEGMPTLENIHPLNGSFVNMAYRLPNGNYVKFLDNDVTYLGNQLPSIYDNSICFGIVCNMEFILICTYGVNGSNPELIVYKKR